MAPVDPGSAFWLDHAADLEDPEYAESYALALDAEANRTLGFVACPGDHSQPTCTTCRAAV